MKNKTLAILTPTYNRANYIERLFISLKNQNSYNFNWYIIDDGSDDNTADLVSKFHISNVNIKYIKKSNGGKHTAINEGLKYIHEPLTMIVDSDDVLPPDSVSIVCSDYQNYFCNSKIAGVSYYKKDLNSGEVVGDTFPTRWEESNYIDFIINKKIKGDKAEVFKTSILSKYPFPVFSNENFLSEAIIWIEIAKKYNFYYSTKCVYYCEYLKNGLTTEGRKKIFLSPKGYVLYSKSMMYFKIKTTIKLKYLLLYVVSALATKNELSKAFKDLEFPKKILFIINFIPGLMLFVFWKVRTI